MVIILSNAEDAHVPLVTKHLNCGYIIIDTSAIAEGVALSFKPTARGSEVYYNGIKLDAVSGVWYRRPILKAMLMNVPDNYVRYSQDAIRHLFIQLYVAFPDAHWISDPFAIERAEIKSLQLVAAKQLGFRVPDTLFTSSAKEAQQFARKHKDTVVKTLSRISPSMEENEEGSSPALFTRRTVADELEYTNLHLGPSIFTSNCSCGI